jgi:hypothetical protein
MSGGKWLRQGFSFLSGWNRQERVDVPHVESVPLTTTWAALRAALKDKDKTFVTLKPKFEYLRSHVIRWDDYHYRSGLHCWMSDSGNLHFYNLDWGSGGGVIIHDEEELRSLLDWLSAFLVPAPEEGLTVDQTSQPTQPNRLLLESANREQQ